MSFPGGALERGESSRDAAQRELTEELFATQDPAKLKVDWLAALDSLFVFVSNIVVTPWVGVLRQPPQWQPQANEVADVLSLSIEQLLATEEPAVIDITRGSFSFSAPCLSVQGHNVWGTTAALLGDLRGRLLAARA